MRTLFVIIVVGSALVIAQNTPPSSGHSSAAAPEDLPTFRVDVKLVNVFVSVLDRHGAPVSNLAQSNFRLLEDGHAEKIALFSRESELPLSIVMAIDTSLSTKKDLKLELESARRFARAILRPVDRLSLYQFSEVVDELVPFTANLDRIDRGINRVRGGAATALYDVLFLGAQALQNRRGRKVMVVITDGGDTASKVDYPEAVRQAQMAEAIVYSIIVVPIASDAGRDVGGEHALIQLSRDTGGRHYYAGSISQLDEAFRKIGDELRTQYLLAYYPSRRLADSSFRHIEVLVDAPGEENLQVRHRSGYTSAPR